MTTAGSGMANEGDGRGSVAHLRIAVVDSAETILAFMRLLFELEEYDVTTFDQGSGTFDKIAALAPALVIVDLPYGGPEGWDLLEQLHADRRTRDIPVVVLSTDPRLLAQAEADPTRYGGRLFVTKPMDTERLIEGIAALVGRGGRPLPTQG